MNLLRFLLILGLSTATVWASELLEAVHADDLARAQALVGAGADVNQANAFGIAALTLACENGNAEIVRLLLGHGADPETKRRGNETALMTAARTGRVGCVKALVEGGAKLDAKERRGQTALMWAAAQGHSAVVEYLLSEGADFKTPLKSGFTSLFFAVRQGHLDVVQVLLKAGADVKDAARPQRSGGRNLRSGMAPLLVAVENGHFELAIALVDAGADPNDQRSGYTALHTITWVRKSVRGDGIDGVPIPEGSGRLGSLGFVRELVKRGAEVNTKLKKGSGGASRLHRKGATPFLLASETADLPLMKLFIGLGADHSIGNVENSMPVHAAAGLGVTAPGEEAGLVEDSLVALVYLLELGADIDAVDDRGETVMHCAAYKCEPAMIQLLDKRGADIGVWNQKNKHGWTPLMIAQGFRPGNFRPLAYVVKAMEEVMRSHGIEPPPPPARGLKKKSY